MRTTLTLDDDVAAKLRAEAEQAVSSWLEQPSVWTVEPGERHWEILRELLRSGQVSGPLVIDAALAALAIEHGGGSQGASPGSWRQPQPQSRTTGRAVRR